MPRKNQLYRIPRSRSEALEAFEKSMKTYLFEGITPAVFATLEKVAVKSIRKGIRAVVVTRGSVLKDHLVRTLNGDRYERYLDWVHSDTLKDLRQKHFAHAPFSQKDQVVARKRLEALYSERELLRGRLEEIKGEIYDASREVILTHGIEGVYLDVNGKTDLYHASYAVSKTKPGVVVYFNRANYADRFEQS